MSWEEGAALQERLVQEMISWFPKSKYTHQTIAPALDIVGKLVNLARRKAFAQGAASVDASRPKTCFCDCGCCDY